MHTVCVWKLLPWLLKGALWSFLINKQKLCLHSVVFTKVKHFLPLKTCTMMILSTSVLTSLRSSSSLFLTACCSIPWHVTSLPRKHLLSHELPLLNCVNAFVQWNQYLLFYLCFDWGTWQSTFTLVKVEITKTGIKMCCGASFSV